MRIYWRNYPVKFQPDPISNEGAYILFEEVTPQEEQQDE